MHLVGEAPQPSLGSPSSSPSPVVPSIPAAVVLLPSEPSPSVSLSIADAASSPVAPVLSVVASPPVPNPGPGRLGGCVGQPATAAITATAGT